MDAIRLAGPGRFERLDLPEPPPPGPGEALVRVSRVGVCGTDFSAFRGMMPYIQGPRILGHELGVEVERIGAEVKGLRPGDRCAVEPYLDCGSCLACRRGRSNCCERLEVLGVHVDGGMRTRIILPARKLHSSRTLSTDQLALVETLAIGAHALRRAAPVPGEPLLVLGAGPIGLSVALFARAAGARVTVVETHPQRRAFAGAVGEPGDSLFPVVFDATGNAGSMSRAVERVSHSGKLVYVGITPENVSLPDPILHRREITLLASRNALPEDFRRIIGEIEAGRIDTRSWVTHRASFGEFIGAFPAFTRPETGVLKALVEMEDAR